MRLGIDASHLASRDARPKVKRTWSDEDLRVLVEASVTYAEVQRKLGYRPSGGIHRYLKAHIARLGLDTSHFVGQSWMRGQSKPIARRRVELGLVLVKGSLIGSGHLRHKLVKAGLKQERCEACGLAEWQGERLSLELDHINGDHTDNRLENLRILCPNCHSITETWCGRKQRPA